NSGVLITNGDNNFVQGNIIGLTSAGDARLSNTNHGVLINGDSDDNTIGGVTSNPRNRSRSVILWQCPPWIATTESTTSGNSVLGNLLGLDAGGTVNLFNSVGVQINGSSFNTIGGTTSTARNIISGNGVGISIINVGATGNIVQGNFIGTSRDGLLDKG